jgi:hypothetical protein
LSSSFSCLLLPRGLGAVLGGYLDLVPERVVRTDDVSSIAMFSGRSNWEDVMWVNIRKYYRAFKEDAVKELLELIPIAVAVLQRNLQRRPTQKTHKYHHNMQ